jgi:hypothetical protein
MFVLLLRTAGNFDQWNNFHYLNDYMPSFFQIPIFISDDSLYHPRISNNLK